jgi:hypothetical protein
MDKETKQIVIQKTWCHGQALAPFYGIACGYWATQQSSGRLRLLVAAVLLPAWSVVSYRSIFVHPKYRTIVAGGALTMVAHIGVFSVAIQELSDTFHLFMCIASGLFFVETGAFLMVATFFRASLERHYQTVDEEERRAPMILV